MPQNQKIIYATYCIILPPLPHTEREDFHPARLNSDTEAWVRSKQETKRHRWEEDLTL